ncbi:hypothetical protein [Aeromonas veronii]|uniref:hypothetical protein n=1 Tax=Aeromonas veronii TaxID=654 RepID=UPI002245912A|nr:hypothetical protein [Aeromonas veronii]MCX0428875.1 hypothetical protein [Aeromonas veronii]MCX0448384.1 hypothetical protein [Aeromonas veronii]
MKLSHRTKLAHKRSGLAKAIVRKYRLQAWRRDLAAVCVEVSAPAISAMPIVVACQSVAAAVRRLIVSLQQAGAAQARLIRGQF